MLHTYIFPLYSVFEEGDESPTLVLAQKQVYMCCIYNSDLNGSLDNYIFQPTYGQQYKLKSKFIEVYS